MNKNKISQIINNSRLPENVKQGLLKKVSIASHPNEILTEIETQIQREKNKHQQQAIEPSPKEILKTREIERLIQDKRVKLHREYQEKLASLENQLEEDYQHAVHLVKKDRRSFFRRLKNKINRFFLASEQKSAR